MKKNFLEYKKDIISTYKKYPTKEQSLDMITLIVKCYMDSLTSIEQALVHELIMLTKNKESNFLATNILSKKLREPSATISVYLKKLVDSEVVTRKKLNNKNFEYAIEFKELREWFYMRYSKRKNNV